MKKGARDENQMDGQEVWAQVQEVRSLLYKRHKEQSDKDLYKKEDLDKHAIDDKQSGVYQEEGELRLKTKCTKRSRNTLLGVESSIKRIQKRHYT